MRIPETGDAGEEDGEAVGIGAAEVGDERDLDGEELEIDKMEEIVVLKMYF